MPNNFLIKNLDDLINVSELEACHLEICAGIAKSKTNMSSRVIPHFEMQKDFDQLFRYKSSEQARIDSVANEGSEILRTEEEKNYFNQLTHEQKKRFLQLYKKAYSDGEYVRLKFPKNEFLRHSFSTFNDSMCEWHPNSEFFPNRTRLNSCWSEPEGRAPAANVARAK